MGGKKDWRFWSLSHPRNSRDLIADGAFGQAADKPYSLLFNRV